ncbi:perlucin-like [Haliotis cracherodii]|uniref:perlucin-like n=1 Tax=Haliotis cracherodii TaxID=6455 RepID=UPI0039EC5F78
MRLVHLLVFLSMLTLADAGKSRCPVGFVQHGRSCYWFSNVRGSFPEAASYCRYFGSHLAIITSRNEDGFIRGYASRHGKGRHYWIGATDLILEGRWRWEGHHPVTYTHWNPGQPDNAYGRTEHCLELRQSYHYRWNDYICDKKLQSICETEV